MHIPQQYPEGLSPCIMLNLGAPPGEPHAPRKWRKAPLSTFPGWHHPEGYNESAISVTGESGSPHWMNEQGGVGEG